MTLKVFQYYFVVCHVTQEASTGKHPRSVGLENIKNTNQVIQLEYFNVYVSRTQQQCFVVIIQMNSYAHTYNKHATRLAVSLKCLCTRLLSSARNLPDNIPEGTDQYKRSARVGTCPDHGHIHRLDGRTGWTESPNDFEKYQRGIHRTGAQDSVQLLRIHRERGRQGASERSETHLDT